MGQIPIFLKPVWDQPSTCYIGESDLVHSIYGILGASYFHNRSLPGLLPTQVLQDPGKPFMHGSLTPLPYINVIIKGIKQINSAKEPTRVRLPITTSLMERIKSSLATKPHQWVIQMVWAACCTGCFGFLRCAEFLTPDNTSFNPKVHWTISDLEYVHSDMQPYISLRIKASKTDQFHEGTMVTLGATKQKSAQLQLSLTTWEHVTMPQAHCLLTATGLNCTDVSL